MLAQVSPAFESTNIRCDTSPSVMKVPARIEPAAKSPRRQIVLAFFASKRGQAVYQATWVLTTQGSAVFWSTP